ncbi:MAG: ATPase inhibitor subunit zeta, partial [Alphaproteobacteria bacterium]
MSAFDDREKEFEAKFKHDQDIQFKVVARRNRLLGEWAGQ